MQQERDTPWSILGWHNPQKMVSFRLASTMTAKATLLAGSDKQEVQLQPVDGKLEAAGNFKVASGTKAVVAVSKVGKAVASVRFTLK